MNLELFIARRLLKGSDKHSVSVPIVRIALVGIALGMCVMLLSVFIITGFKKEITDKVTGFSSHLNIVSYGNYNSYTGGRIVVTDTLVEGLKRIKGVASFHGYVMKPTILKSEKEIHGAILYGVDSSFHASFFRDNLKQGRMPDFTGSQTSSEILLSGNIASMLDLSVGDKIQAHFVQEPPRVRVFTVAGIYNTGFKEYDDIFVLCDLRHLQRLNAWNKEEMTGIAVDVTDIAHLPAVYEEMDETLPLENGNDFYKIETLYDRSPAVFDWLELLNMNVWVILILLLTVAGFNMVSGLLILILDKTLLIGILKSLGYKNVNLRKLFLYISAGLIGKGMVWGNVLAFTLGAVQYYFHIVRLDPATYYMDTVPVYFNLWYVVWLNIGVLVVSVSMLIVPTMLISRIRPIKTIRFE
ncbi:ABC transporter permease [Odoribacter lunatus]|uniref:ABC transporter permease n=1 Tax=Odoribacter lunatus TaxID=2941335 RepID=UPI00203F91E0|nr:ABC transporter permease [Odoribacter lunatus]